jgi:hypothetical protein
MFLTGCGGIWKSYVLIRHLTNPRKLLLTLWIALCRGWALRGATETITAKKKNAQQQKLKQKGKIFSVFLGVGRGYSF